MRMIVCFRHSLNFRRARLHLGPPTTRGCIQHSEAGKLDSDFAFVDQRGVFRSVRIRLLSDDRREVLEPEYRKNVFTE